MKKILYVLSTTALALLLAGCEQQDILRYDPERAAIEFANTESTFSFRMQEATEVVVSIPLNIVGYPSSVERRATFTVLADSTTASPNQYEILDAIVPADSYQGTLRILVRNNQGDDFEDVKIWLLAAAGADFIPGTVSNNYYILKLTNRLVKPTWWSTAVAASYLGSYSAAYYTFIIETTGEMVYPMAAAITVDGVRYERWSAGYTNSFILLLRDALKERNNRVGSPLLHGEEDDVDAAARGKEVVVGLRYT